MGTTYYYTVNDEIMGEHTLGQSRLDYVTDALGSVIATVDQTLTVQSTARYKPFGANLATSGTQVKFGWAGSRGYRQTGLPHSDIYVRARHLGTIEGRWTSADPVWPRQLAYEYGNSNPTLLTDPSGLQVCLPNSPAFWEKIISPKKPKGWGQDYKWDRCSQTPRGGCPHQDPTTSWIDLEAFDKPGQPGGNPDNEMGRCDPSDPNFNWAALANRLAYVQNFINTQCGNGGGGGGSGDPAPAPDDTWATTIPCYEPTPTGQMISCRIRCSARALGANFVQSGNHQASGVGCAMKCLLTHEMQHCKGIYAGNFDQGSIQSECAGYQAEAKCLQNILSQKPS